MTLLDNHTLYECRALIVVNQFKDMGIPPSMPHSFNYIVTIMTVNVIDYNHI